MTDIEIRTAENKAAETTENWAALEIAKYGHLSSVMKVAQSLYEKKSEAEYTAWAELPSYMKAKYVREANSVTATHLAALEELGFVVMPRIATDAMIDAAAKEPSIGFGYVEMVAARPREIP
jgi:hypothetical protein